MPTRIIITGDRHWTCADIAAHVLAGIRAKLGTDVVIVHGDCPTGVDRSFRYACEAMGIPHEPHPADWHLGKKGGPIRNSEMVRLGAAYAIAVHRTLARSRGTRDCVRKCLGAGITVWLIDGGDRPRRLTEDDLTIEPNEPQRR